MLDTFLTVLRVTPDFASTLMRVSGMLPVLIITISAPTLTDRSNALQILRIFLDAGAQDSFRELGGLVSLTELIGAISNLTPTASPTNLLVSSPAFRKRRFADIVKQLKLQFQNEAELFLALNAALKGNLDSLKTFAFGHNGRGLSSLLACIPPVGQMMKVCASFSPKDTLMFS